MSPRAPRAERNFDGDGDVPDQRIFATLAATHPSRELSDHMLTIWAAQLVVSSVLRVATSRNPRAGAHQSHLRARLQCIWAMSSAV